MSNENNFHNIVIFHRCDCDGASVRLGLLVAWGGSTCKINGCSVIMVIKCVFVLITVSVPLGFGLQVGQVGVEGHGCGQCGRLSLGGKHRPKLFQESNVDFRVMDLGKHGSWKNQEIERLGEGKSQIIPTAVVILYFLLTSEWQPCVWTGVFLLFEPYNNTICWQEVVDSIYACKHSRQDWLLTRTAAWHEAWPWMLVATTVYWAVSSVVHLEIQD